MTSYTKRSIGIFLLGLSLFEACKTQETLPTDQVALRQKESALVNNLTVQVDTLQRSGCGRCFIAYSVFVSALISTTTAQQRVRLSLYSSTPRQDSTGIVLAGQSYKVILRDVTPHPASDLPTSAGSEPARAVIQVSKL